jgi:hypothetical protein
MKYDHPSIRIDTPIEGHYVIQGHNPKSILTETGHVVPIRECYITDEIPDDTLEAILEDREKRRESAATTKRPATKSK